MTTKLDRLTNGVYIYITGSYDVGCTGSCTCQHGHCDVVSGECACDNGYTGTHCDQACTVGYIGYGNISNVSSM